MALALTLSADDVGGKLKLVPAEPLREPAIPPRATRPAEPVNRPSTLSLKPPSDPIFLVEESVDTAGEWRTYRRPKVDAFSRNADGVALDGYDMISYREQAPLKGSKAFAFESGGVIWWFSSAAHRDLFKSDINRFVPEYGGFCAYSIGKGYPATADPQAYSVDGDKLYLFFDRVALKVWEADRRLSISKADRNWPKLHR
ncbi:MAG: hypothetical protein HYX27_09905 [Acidobacteria bacterium]|nr:hypothetical protein [Acidobacteriota bacterium]